MSSAPGLTRLSFKLGLVLFLTVASALAIVGLAVLPQLESRLVNAKIRELERVAPTVTQLVASVENPFRLQDVTSVLSSNANARVIVFDTLTETSLRPVADSSGLSSEDVITDPVALRAAVSGLTETGRVRRDERSYAEVATPLANGDVVLLAAPLADALSTVKLVRRSLIIAGGIALAVSWIVGYLAAVFFTRRITRLERAAERIARGDFTQPIVDTGRDEIGQLANAFEGMRQRLSQLEHARREFIANASHELRTPLFSLGGFLELLDDEDLDEATRREFLTEMREQVERLTRLATDLLDLTRLDAGQLSVETAEVDLGAVAQVAADEFRAVADATDHELRLSWTDTVHAVADEEQVLRIARILVENALRHTPRGTDVTVEVSRWEARALLVVRDNGPGIPPADRGRLFDRFYRGTGVKASGSGLGLAIAHELATRMAGTLKADSRPGATVFTLSLPLSGSLPQRENTDLVARDAVST